MNISLSKIPPSLGSGLSATAIDKPALVGSYQIFKGNEHNPLLAPRGVWKYQNYLMVSDTGQNRVFIWNQIPSDTYANPDIVLGQIEQSDTGRNAGSTVSASTLQYPSGIWTDGTKLIIADAWNHRVLIWHSFPTKNGQAADVVIGQPNFEQNEPNIRGIGSTPSAQSLNWPYGVFSDGTHLWICDTGNRRILFYNSIPTENFAAASKVIGKPSFTERDYENYEPIWPYSLRVSTNGVLAITDTQFYRTLIWHHWKDAFTKTADVIIGQPDFDSNGMNQFSLAPKQDSMSWTYDSFFYKNGIFVADTGNSRLLWFENIPSSNAPEADNLLGHYDFNTGSENTQTRFGTDTQLYWPFSICVDGEKLVLADTGNHRLIIYDIL
ncbi:NHL repeat containing protein [Emticicia oligotrophica DSM 17448]|uniref:NHL repeat containing protein n=1 Tax=Emticicia oligotrophica (strain DSM 17448 / CIP 109782 / MTCC 6937 / GPTSA100-15) TaxID=929562 RepID=A0ABM5N3P0_EMTOG|nr:hypothetical protein [Emticicia oligotrophica]AFK03961.1 NHL repeat containing protein [Emticicia oligotrophica DSM 17448]